MKSFLLLILPSLFFLTSFIPKPEAAIENFKVIKVFGQIVVSKTGASLKSGDLLEPTAQLRFKTPEAKASVVSSKSGRFTLASDGKSESTMRSSLVPAMTNISARNGSILNLVDLQAYFSGNHVIMDEIALFVSPSAFRMDDESFFFLQYEFDGEKINKKLTSRNDSLLINKEALFTIDGNPVNIPAHTGMTLYYYSEKISSLIGQVNLVFPDESGLKQEAAVLLNEMEGKSAKEKTDEFISYLSEFYGKPEKKSIERWLFNNFKVSAE